MRVFPHFDKEADDDYLADRLGSLQKVHALNSTKAAPSARTRTRDLGVPFPKFNPTKLSSESGPIDLGVQAGANSARSGVPDAAFVETSMNLKVAIAASLFVSIAAVAYAQQNGPPGRPPKPTMADIQKLVQTINGDKAKLRTYCEFGKVMEQIDRAGQGKDTNAVKTLGAKANNLAQQLGPDYIRIMQGLNDVDPNSAEGKRLDTLFEPLVKQCNKG